ARARLAGRGAAGRRCGRPVAARPHHASVSVEHEPLRSAPMIPTDRRRFARALGIILFAALGLRVGYVLTVTRHDQHFYDALYYDAEARAIEDGRGFVDPFAVLQHRPATPTAAHPPLTSVVLVPAAWLSDDTVVMRFEMTLP